MLVGEDVQDVWIDGYYVDQVQANGTIARVWVPGHYEKRRVIPQNNMGMLYYR